VVLAVGAGRVRAQEEASGSAASSSGDLTATVAAIAADRSAFAAGIAASWRAHAQERGFQEGWEAELQRALESRTPGELLVASRAKTWTELVGRALNYRNPGPSLVGGSLDDLIYVPITPCRIVDTRPGAGGSGAITAGTSKNFLTNGSAASIAGQGGNPAGCPDIPFDPPAVAATVTAVAPAAAGNITAYPYLATLPTASTVNYALPGTGLNLANTTVIPTCVVCGLDFSVFANVGTAHVVIDVVGYFQAPQCPAVSTGFNGHCYETATRAAATVFAAGDTCAAAGGRLANGTELRALRSSGTGIALLTLDANGEWIDSVFSPDDVNFYAMRVRNNGGFNRDTTLTTNPFRCVFDN
jgi:hypothetical protein